MTMYSVELERCLSLIRERLGFDFPTELIPSAVEEWGLEARGELVVSPQAAADIHVVQGDVNRFITAAPYGYFAIGFWGHGINSYAFYFQLVDYWRRIFLRLRWGGVFMDDDACAADIRRYLTAFAKFIATARERDVYQVIVAESMGVAEYLVRIEPGRVMSSCAPLLGAPDPFTGLMAHLDMGDHESVHQRIFEDDETGYRRWLDEHPLGFVVNAHRKPKPEYMILHRSDCKTISARDVIYTSGAYLKACAMAVTDYIEWTESYGAALQECGRCNPLAKLDIEGRRIE